MIIKKVKRACFLSPSRADVVAAPSSLPLAAVFALLALPGTVIKQITNVEQLRTSFARLAAFEHKGK